MVERLGLTLITHHTPPPQLLTIDPLAPLHLAGDDGPPSPDLVLLLLLLLLVTSFGVKPYPFALVPRCRSPSSSVTHRLGPTIESNDSGARPLLDGVVRWVNQRSSQVPHRLLRSGGVPESEGPASLEGSAGGGPDVVREGVGEVGSVVMVRGASGPWGRPRGPMEMCAVRRIADASVGPVTTKMRPSSPSSPSSSSP
jgi:hypothetical protein